MRRLRRPTGGLWGHADFLKLWTGQSISELGSQVSQLAIPWVALVTLKSSAFEIATLGTVQFLPFVLFTLPAGVWVDWVSRRLVLIVGDIGRALLLATIPLTFVLGVLTLWQLYVVAFLVGVHTVFFDVAYQSYLPSLIDREALVEGNSKLQVTVSGAGVAGPGLAGILIRVATAPYAILVDAFSFVVSGGFTVAIRKREERQREREQRRLLPELWEGLRYVLGHRYLRPQALSTGISNFFTNVAFAILIVYAHRRLGLSSFAIGLALSIGAFGWMLGASQADRMRRLFGVGGATIIGSAISGPSLLLVPFAPRGDVAVVFLAAADIVLGFGAVVYNIQQVSLRQTITPTRIQGRMNATMRFLVWGTIPLGSLTGGALAATLGLRTALFVGALGSFVSVLPIVFSPIRGLRDFPEPEEDVPIAYATVEAHA
ncbi:MAG TPA: MFS transporter [Gaiellaceae bacterium]|nr:MFS transporter [Gaiellaceae bacterium]